MESYISTGTEFRFYKTKALGRQVVAMAARHRDGRYSPVPSCALRNGEDGVTSRTFMSSQKP